jgi:hypothetical protein
MISRFMTLRMTGPRISSFATIWLRGAAQYPSGCGTAALETGLSRHVDPTAAMVALARQQCASVSWVLRFNRGLDLVLLIGRVFLVLLALDDRALI